MKTFTHLHVHTDYSILDGLGKIKPSDGVGYVERAKKLGMHSLAITDHGNVSGAWVFYNACKEADINPLLGEEFYFAPKAMLRTERKKEKVKEERDLHHVVLIARNRDGFRTIADLNTEANFRFHYKPVIDRELLESFGDALDNIVCLSGCAASIISRTALEEGVEAAQEEVLWWKSVFRHFYIELQHHGTDFDRKLNKRLLKLARRQRLPWVVTNDPHYVLKEEDCHHDALLAIQTGSSIDAPTRFRFDGSGYHLRSRREMERAFADYGESVWKPGIVETNRVAKKCRIEIPEWERKSWHIPRYPGTDDAQRDLRRRVRMGLRERGLDSDPVYVERGKSELRDIKKVGIADFLLIDADFKNHAKEVGIATGPGRGSVCGTLVGYLVGNHKIDPIRAGLRFDRFLNVERPKMPDVDTDYEPDRREEMFDYAADLYGAENTQRVAAFQTMKIKGAFQKLASAHDITPADRNRYTKLLGDSWDGEEDADGNEEEVEDVSILPEDLRESYPDLATQMRALVGTKSAISRHAAGLVIFNADDPIKEINPQQFLINASAKGGGHWASSYDLKTIEGMGLLKEDFLGLRTLATISETVRMVRERHDIELDPDAWVPDEERHDRAIYKMLADGKVGGVFQMEGNSNRKGIQEIKCSCFEDIVACTSLYRAGPIIAGSPKRFLANKKAGKLNVIHPSLEPWLKNSWGEMIYQEQMMDMAEHCAGFDGGGIADLLAATRFKDPALFEPLKEKFVAGAQEIAGMTQQQAEKTWEMIAASASYLFNRSHAYAYSFITYQTARLKHLFPLEFFTALIRTVKPTSDQAKRRRHDYLAEAHDMGFRILPPDVNLSDVKATCGEDEEGPWLRLGLSDCKGVGVASANVIIRSRIEGGATGFFSVDEAQEEIGKRAFEALELAGAMESIGGLPMNETLAADLLGWEFDDQMAPWREKFEAKLKTPKFDNGSVCLYGRIMSVESRKTKAGKKFVVWTVQWSPSMKWRISLWSDADECWHIKKGSIVRIKGRWSKEFENVGVSDPEQVKVLHAQG